jgi:DNA mismatch repair protein MutS
MLKQYLSIKDEHKDKILFFRMGDFYEMFFEDAVIASKILNIALTSRHKEDNIPMCGIPFHALSNYTQKLLDNGHKIAICEQVEDPKLTKKIVKRKVVKVLTPAINSEVDNLFANENYFLFTYYKNNLAIVDFATGDFNYELNVDINQLIGEIEKHFPKEIIISDNDLKELKKETYIEFYNFSVNLINENLLHTNNSISDYLQGYKNLPEVITISLNYILENNKFIPKHLKKPEKISINQYLILDENAITHLEIFKEGSLYSILNKCSTPMGSRNLRKWLSYPLTDKRALLERYDFIEKLIETPKIKRKLLEILKQIRDIERLNSKIALKNILPQHLINLKEYLKLIPQIKKELSKIDTELSKEFNANLFECFEFIEKVEKFILPDPSNNINNGGFINRDINKELDELINIRFNSRKWLLNYEASLKKKFNITNLKIKFNKVFGYFIEISKRNTINIPDTFMRKQTLVNAERYITEELKEFEEKILTADEKISKIEKKIYFNLLNELSEYCLNIKKVSDIISSIDILSTFSEISVLYDYVKPEINNENKIEVIDGRHPVLDTLKEDFIPNNLEMNEKNKIFIITGPNMAGKSTYMRQNALIIIMAQIGCFVPAKKLSYPIFNRIFTRIGAKDKILEDESTFMVEMNETSKILQNITEKSFIILDEIGRGTSTYDGMSIAWAILEYCAGLKKDFFLLFATHYHELTVLEQSFSNIKNYSVDVKEVGNKLVFLRQIKKGPADRSYGIEVASLAKLPDTIIKRAKEILSKLENRQPPRSKPKIKEKTIFDNIFKNEKELILEDIENIDILNTTPLDALKILSSIQNKLKKLK